MEDVRRASQAIEKCPDCGKDVYYTINSNNKINGRYPKPTAFDKGTSHIHKITCGKEPSSTQRRDDRAPARNSMKRL